MNDNEKQIFDHNRESVSDKIRLVSELEHIRYHAMRSASVLVTEEKPDETFPFLVIAKRAQELRRKYMANSFPQINSKYWCLCKSAACLRQISYEVGGDEFELQEIDSLVDDIWGSALDMDLTGCEACIADMSKSDTIEE